MGAMSPVSHDHPLMMAWKAWQESDSGKNTES